MEKKNTLLEIIFIFFKGLLMGSADIVPGVSGGTIAFITGIYTRLIDSINYIIDQINTKNISAFFRLRFKYLWRKISKIDWTLFIPLFIGIASAMLLLSNLIHYLMKEHQVLTYSFFFGLIIGSAVYIYKTLKNISIRDIFSFTMGFAIGFFIVGLESLSANHSSIILFFSGMIAICAMILPGISGAFILVLLNQYEYVLNMIRSFSIKEIMIFGIGALIGILSFSRILEYLLHKKRNETIMFLVGLMIGSLRLHYDILSANPPSVQSSIIIILIITFGFSIVFIFENLGKKLSKSKKDF